MQLCAKCIFKFSYARLIVDIFVLLLRKYGLSMDTCPQYVHEIKETDRKQAWISFLIYGMTFVT